MTTGREELLALADDAVGRLGREPPEPAWLGSLRRQLACLHAVARGEEADRSLLARINIGVIAAREVEDRDAAAAAILHRVAALARQMAAESGAGG